MKTKYTVLNTCLLLLLAMTNSAFADWYNANWAYRKAITIDHTKVPNTDQANFPVLISLNHLNGMELIETIYVG